MREDGRVVRGGRRSTSSTTIALSAGRTSGTIGSGLSCRCWGQTRRRTPAALLAGVVAVALALPVALAASSSAFIGSFGGAGMSVRGAGASNRASGGKAGTVGPRCPAQNSRECGTGGELWETLQWGGGRGSEPPKRKGHFRMSLNLTTFNLLAPCYKRIESHGHHSSLVAPPMGLMGAGEGLQAEPETSTVDEALEASRADIDYHSPYAVGDGLHAASETSAVDGALEASRVDAHDHSSATLEAAWEGIRSSVSEVPTGKARESHFDDLWRNRATDTLQFLKQEVVPETDILCFQEFWFEPAYQDLFRRSLEENYVFHTFQRTGRKADGIAVLLRKGEWHAESIKGESLGTVGNRVVLFLHLKKAPEDPAFAAPELLLANTHLSFPHSNFDREIQQQQVKNLISHMESFAVEANVPPSTPRIIVGDFNSEEGDPVGDILREEGYATAFSADQSTLGQRRVVTHHNHQGDDVMVDHVWIRVSDSDHAEVVDEAPVSRACIQDVKLKPECANPEVWNEDFSISDHRPVSVVLQLEKHKLIVDHTENGDEGEEKYVLVCGEEASTSL